MANLIEGVVVQIERDLRLAQLRGQPVVSVEVEQRPKRTPRRNGGTPGFFSDEDMNQSLDFLFIDEAGQVSHANAIAVATAARNVVPASVRSDAASRGAREAIDPIACARVCWHTVKRTTVKLPEEIDTRLRHEASVRGSTIAEITRQAIEEHLGVGGRRRLIAAKAGRSGRHDTARRIEEIIRKESRR